LFYSIKIKIKSLDADDDDDTMLIILKDNDDTMLIILKIEICLTSNEMLRVYKLKIKKNLKELFNNLLLFNNIQTQFNDGIIQNNRVYLNIK
jgi:hypothetical protein